MSKEKTIEYSNDDITILWNAHLCKHAAVCVNTLPNVYKPNERPWININNATTEELKSQIAKCPSGALTYKSTTMEKGEVAGQVPQMEELEAGKTYAWCACGKSGNQPWCDGSHTGTAHTPTVFTAEENKKAAMCMCKQSKNPPYCDGSHANL